MKEANSMKNLWSYQWRSIGFSLTQVRINREKKKSKADPAKIFVEATVRSSEAPPAVCWVRTPQPRSLLAKLGKESELKPHCHRNTNFCIFLFLIKPHMRTANKFHVSWLYRRKNLNVCITWQCPSSLEAGWNFQSIPTGCVLFTHFF